jgi:putative endonuclease
VPWVYLLRCGDGSLYAGAARDLPRRLSQHAAGRASRYTRAHLPVTLAWSRRLRTWSATLREEARIKRLRRPDKDALIAATRGSARRPGRAAGRLS